MRIAPEKQAGIHVAFGEAAKFPTLTSIARHFGVSKNTVKAYLTRLVEEGSVSEKNHLLFSTRKNTAATFSRLVQRRKDMRLFLQACVREETPVSVNLLVRKFGGEKKVAKAMIDAINKELAAKGKPLLRRLTVADQN
jgi:DNA-binding IclR family transcriptional regulator